MSVMSRVRQKRRQGGETRKVGGRGKKTAQGKEVNQNDEPVADSPRPRIEPEDYKAICYGTDYGKAWGNERRMYVLFRIIEGRYDGTELFMACRCPKGKKITNRYKLYKQWSRAMGRLPHKGEHLTGKAFVGKMFKVRVRYNNAKTVDNEPEPDFLQYSLVDHIVETLTGINPDE